MVLRLTGRYKLRKVEVVMVSISEAQCKAFILCVTPMQLCSLRSMAIREENKQVAEQVYGIKSEQE